MKSNVGCADMSDNLKKVEWNEWGTIIHPNRIHIGSKHEDVDNVPLVKYMTEKEGSYMKSNR